MNGAQQVLCYIAVGVLALFVWVLGQAVTAGQVVVGAEIVKTVLVAP